MASTTKQRRGANPAGTRNGSHSRVGEGFAPGSLEAELSAIGKSVPAREWAKLPADYFAKLDHYLYGAPRKK